MIQDQLQRPMGNPPTGSGNVSATGSRSRQTRELTRRLGKLTEAQAALGWAVVLVLLALAGAIYLLQSSRIAAAGRQAQQLRFELNELEQANTDLEREIAAAQTLDRLRSEAEAMGFVPATAADVDYLVIRNYPSEEERSPSGQLPADVAPLEPEPAPIETMAGALQTVLSRKIDELMRGESNE
jgi:hypothetical protein